MKPLALLIAALTLSLALTYDTSTVTTACGTGCIANCKICYGARCIQCRTGYTLNYKTNVCAANTCTSLSGCATCNAAATICYTCTDPYKAINAAGNACVSGCPLSNCDQCLTGSNACITCSTGYTLYSLTNQCIPTSIANCVVAYDYRGKQFQCTTCKSTFKPSVDQTLCVSGTCTAITNCLTCAVTTVCTVCRDGYSVNATNSTICQPNACVVSNCLYCNNLGVCQRCLSTHTLFGGLCIKNTCSLQNCATCKTGSIYCDQCSAGYTLNIWTKSCDFVTPVSSDNSKLVYLWFLTIPVVIIIVVAIVCIYKKVKSATLSNQAVHSNLQQNSKIQKQAASKQNLDMSFQNGQHLHESPSRKHITLEPIKPAPLPKQLH